MANLGHKDISGQIPRSTNVGTVQAIPGMQPGSIMGLYNSMSVPQGLTPGLMVPNVLPWGTGVVSGVPLVPVNPYVTAQMSMSAAIQQNLPQANQSNTQSDEPSTNENKDHKEHRREHRKHKDDHHSDRKHKKSHKKRHDEDRHRRKKSKDEERIRSSKSPTRHKESRDSRKRRDSGSPGHQTNTWGRKNGENYKGESRSPGRQKDGKKLKDDIRIGSKSPGHHRGDRGDRGSRKKHESRKDKHSSSSHKHRDESRRGQGTSPQDRKMRDARDRDRKRDRRDSRERDERSSGVSNRGAILLEDRSPDISNRGAILLDDRSPDVSNRGAILLDDRSPDISNRGALLLEDRSPGVSNRGAILLEDRSPDVSNRGAILLDDREEEGAVLLEDGEIDSDSVYSLTNDRDSMNDRRDEYSLIRLENDRDRRNDYRFELDRLDSRRDVERLDSRRDRLDSRLDRLDSRLNRLDSRRDIDRLDSRHDRLDYRLDPFDTRLDPLELRHDQYDRRNDDKRKHDRGSRNDGNYTSRLREDDRYSETSQGRASERSSCRRGRTGAILREDNEKGAILIEDRDYLSTETGRSGAVLIEDRSGSDLDLDDKGRRSRSDRNSPRRFDSERERRDFESTSSHRDFGSTKRRGHSEGRDRLLSDSNLRRSPVRERSVDLLPPPIESNIGRTGAVLIEDREESPIPRHSGPEIGRSGALLLEDRDNNYRSIDKPSRSSDKTLRGSSRGPDKASRGIDKGSRGSDKSFRGEDKPVRTIDKPLRYQDRRDKTFHGRRDRVTDNLSSKRSRSPDLKIKQELRSIIDEPSPKKRKIWEPDPNDISTAKCIRTASQATMNDMNTLFSEPVASWIRCSAADLYFRKDVKTGNMIATKRMQELEDIFDIELVQRAAKVTALQEPYERALPKPNWKHKCCVKHNHKIDDDHCSEESSSSDSSDSESDSEDWWMDELKFKLNHPYRLHPEIWYNDPNELNYGPLCRCSAKAKKFGIRHSIYPGEKPLPNCDLDSNNIDKLYHYRVTVSPVKNFLINEPTVIMFDEHEYIFEGFSIFSHKPIEKFEDCEVIRFNIIYTIHVVEEQVPENFSVRSLDLFTEFLFEEILELIDIDWRGPGDGNQCRRYHIMPRFARPFPENGKELLSMNDVLLYLLKASKPLITEQDLEDMFNLDSENWNKFVDSFRHMVVTCPGKKPSSIRIDQLDKADCKTRDGLKFPTIIHHGIRPAQLSYAGDPSYRKKWREYMKYRHLLWTRSKVGEKEKEKLEDLEADLEKIRLKCTLKREISAEIDSNGFLLTGIRADICQHAMLIPVLIEHLRFHECLSSLEDKIRYKFKDRTLLQLALTHSSYKVNYGTNPDHGRNSLSNCGFRQVKFGDFKIHLQHTRKRGLNILLKIMSKMGHKDEVRSEIPHNERLEFLGDAVVEFITSVHLFNMFPQATEGELTLYRGSLVTNAHLAVLADNLRLQDYLLYAHGPDLCHDSNLKHAMANCFEAFLGALFMDGGIKLADRVFSETLFKEEDLLDTWVNTPPHPLITDEPNGDRHWIEQSPVLQKLTSFEEDIGYEFRHIRLLAKAFTQRNVGYNNLTFGHNQRLEFLGDTVMQLICSEYLFRHFPDHHEGHLTLLRSSLVNNKTQSTVAAELGMIDFVIKANMTKLDEKTQAAYDLKTKEKADLLEALLGAMLIDGGLEPCKILIEVCFLPRLKDFILDQEWNDPKSELQQCCLTLRDINDETPDIPVYKVLKASGPTNQRTYTVAVYFREKRLAVGIGGGIQQAEMKAAEAALSQPGGLFPNRIYSSKNKRLHAVSKINTKVKKENV
ncbi:hypothetical protein ACF0H5_022207 [Mactra antiquata]